MSVGPCDMVFPPLGPVRFLKTHKYVIANMRKGLGTTPFSLLTRNIFLTIRCHQQIKSVKIGHHELNKLNKMKLVLMLHETLTATADVNAIDTIKTKILEIEK